MLDITKPLRRSQSIKNKKGRVVTINYKYERPPLFCFICGVMGHGEKDCPNGEDEETGENFEWGT
ncbi:Gag polyprotein [Bienertia sinuspersici]